ncbi:MAG: GtrA family protein [Anaerolineae bacterium]|jgi:putative flippase GtrA|nr:GtrA family protein [Anaerolineae bacterium]
MSRSIWTYPFDLLNRVIFKISLRFGDKAKEVERFLKFSVVGIIGAVVDFGVLNLLQSTALRPEQPDLQLKVALATGTAFTSAVISNFIWNRYWTYPDSRSRPIQQQLVQFFIVNAIGLAFRLWFVRATFEPLGDVGVDALRGLGLADSLTGAATSQLGTNMAQFIALWIVMVWNFFVNRYWTYNDVE